MIQNRIFRSMRLSAWVSLVAVLLFTAACSAPTPAPSPIPPTAVPVSPTVPIEAPPTVSVSELPTLLPTVTLAVPTITNSPTPTEIAVASPLPSVVAVTAVSNIPTITRAPTRAATRVPPTRTLTQTASAPPTPLPANVPQVLITALRVEPATPKAAVGPTFFATFKNDSGQERTYDWCVEVWEAEETKKPFGLSACQDATMPPGVTELASTGWTVKGLGECRAYRARATARDEDDNRTYFIQPNGEFLWVNFTVCP